VSNNRLETFMSRFAFDPSRAWLVGMESECFITDREGAIVPRAADVLRTLHAGKYADYFSPELSACQVEFKTPPVHPEQLEREIKRLQDHLFDTLHSMRLRASFMPVAPDDMPLDVYPSKRSQEIAGEMSHAQLLAACRITARHFHVGLPDHESALRIYNRVRRELTWLEHEGDRSHGERLRIYREATPDWDPPPLANWGELYTRALERGFEGDPRRWWAELRISRHGTLELRTSDASDATKDSVKLARTFHALCMGAR